MIRPFLQDMTKSELHAVLTGGFATIAGSVMAAYILYGVSDHVHHTPNIDFRSTLPRLPSLL